MPERRRVDSKPKPPPEPTEYTVDLTGVSATMYLCPVCGRSGQDKEQMVQHTALHGGEG